MICLVRQSAQAFFGERHLSSHMLRPASSWLPHSFVLSRLDARSLESVLVAYARLAIIAANCRSAQVLCNTNLVRMLWHSTRQTHSRSSKLAVLAVRHGLCSEPQVVVLPDWQFQTCSNAPPVSFPEPSGCPPCMTKSVAYII